MYINPFVAGVLVTLLVQAVALVAWAFKMSIKKTPHKCPHGYEDRSACPDCLKEYRR